jgi:hypothetical protein
MDFTLQLAGRIINDSFPFSGISVDIGWELSSHTPVRFSVDMVDSSTADTSGADGN